MTSNSSGPSSSRITVAAASTSRHHHNHHHRNRRNRRGRHSCAVLVLLTIAVVLAAVVDNAAAKRGCAMFGHSCYGGHGKRSFQAPVLQQQEQQPAPRDWPAANEEQTQVDDAINKYFQMKLSSPYYTPYWQKWIQMYNGRKMNRPSNDNM